MLLGTFAFAELTLLTDYTPMQKTFDCVQYLPLGRCSIDMDHDLILILVLYVFL